MKSLFHQRSALMCCLLLFFAAPGIAQSVSFTVAGTVTEASGDPLIGVTIRLDGTSSGTVTDIDGNYNFSGTGAPGSYTVIYSYIGYANERREFTVSNSGDAINLDVSMSGDALNLDEVIVTGASVATSRRQLGNAVSTLDSKAFEETGAVAVDQALSGKIAGALVQQNSGDPAGGISIRLRGASTISGSSDPLYIIDGIIVNNNSSNLVDLGGNTQNRLVDINPADIDRIEVIKGAAAAAIYGSRASNGVVQIFTKRGKTGQTTHQFHDELPRQPTTKRDRLQYRAAGLGRPFRQR